MTTRTTIVLDDESRQAVEELARHYACSMSEAIRRAVVGHRDDRRSDIRTGPTQRIVGVGPNDLVVRLIVEMIGERLGDGHGRL